jgi:hypothetical protein
LATSPFAKVERFPTNVLGPERSERIVKAIVRVHVNEISAAKLKGILPQRLTVLELFFSPPRGLKPLNCTSKKKRNPLKRCGC